MDPGKLRFLAVYQEPIRTVDAYNNATITGWTDKFLVPCSIRTLKAWEVVKYRSVEMNVTHEIRCRWTPAINATGRLMYQGRKFDLYSINNIDERNRELEILCNEAVKPK